MHTVPDVTTALDLSAITDHQTRRTATIRHALDPNRPYDPPPSGHPIAVDYAVAHHFLEGGHDAAQRRDADALAWHRSGFSHGCTHLTRSTVVGPRIVIAPPADDMVRSPRSETPYYVLGPRSRPAPEALGVLVARAFAHVDETGLGPLVAAHAAVVCLTGQRRPEQLMRNFSITNLPATLFTDHLGDPAVLGRELVHEAAHNWLNDALAALDLTIPSDQSFFSPWRGTHRPAFGFLHACFAFPLTMIYAARALPTATGTAHTVLADHLHQHQAHLAAVTQDFPQALNLVRNTGLRDRLETVFTHGAAPHLSETSH
ncbi:HEXXH motif-containing putative peptide modification protein [Streptomyces sp. NPDC001407]|uniref:aKG-HExxH-type peptide beta-hydroxylase n=1 Tax=Streptomyces sp. NPDC001407 TaxID=3364573 RepID=UPI00369A8623